MKSRYAKLLEPFYKLFDRNNILIVIYENYLNDPRGENLRIQKFLGLPDDAPLDEELIRTPVNPGRIPRSLRLNRLMYRYIRLFRLTRTTKPWRLVRNANLRLGSALPKIDEETASYITELVDEDRGELLDLIQLDRVPWD